MRMITEHEAKRWLAERGFDDGGPFSEFQLGPEALTSRVPTPKHFQGVEALAADLFAHEESAFDGGMLWIVSRVWSGESVETVIARIAESFGLPPDANGAYLFGADELALMKAMFVLASLPNWDVFAVPSHGKYFFMGHHHEVIHLSALPDPTGQEWMASMAPWVKNAP